MNAKQRFSCGVGNALNDLFRQLYFSFTLLFLMKVVGLSASQAGVAVLVGQLTDSFVCSISGYLGDHIKIPFISKIMGRRKSWHLVGAILMTFTIPLLFNRCLLCSEYEGISWLPLAYYITVLVVLCTGYNLVEINHLSIIPAVTKTIKEATALNAIRTVFSFLSGIYVYLIAWGLLGQESGDDVGPSSLDQFAHLSWIATGTGVIFSIVFYVGTKEPNGNRPLRKISTLMDPVNVGGLISASQSIYSMVFQTADENNRESATLAQTLTEMLMSLVKSEESVAEPEDETKERKTEQRKTSLLRRFVNALFLIEDESNGDGSSEETQLSEVRTEDCTEKPADLITQVEKLDQHRKRSLLMRVIDGLAGTMQTQPQRNAVTEEGDENKGVKDDGDKAECSTRKEDFSRNSEREKAEEGSESSYKTEHTDENRSLRRRKNGMEVSLEDLSELGVPNLGYQNESIDHEEKIHSKTCSESDPEQVEAPTLTKRKNSRKLSFFDEQHGYERLEERDDTDVTHDTKASRSTEKAKLETITRKTSFYDEKQNPGGTEEGALKSVTLEPELSRSPEEKNSEETTESRQASSFDEQQNPETTEADEDKETTEVTCDPIPARSPKKKKQKTVKDWLVDPHLYKIAIIVTCSRLVQDAVYAYLPLYLTERMGFGKQAIAYFPIVLLVSSALAGTFSDKLNKKIGCKWTYLLASLLVICGSVYCYFQTPSLRQSTYAPVILIGSGMSVMYVMALAFVTELIGEDTESSGTVFSIVVFIVRMSSGGLFMAIQEFYPEHDSGSNTSTSDYVRHVFSMVPGILALTGFLLVLFVQPPLLRCNKKAPSEDVAVQTAESSTSFDVVVISG